jgi:hypothetical protein
MILFLAWKTVLTFLLILRISKGNDVDKEDKNVGIPDCGICGRLEMGGGGDMMIGITTNL